MSNQTLRAQLEDFLPALPGLAEARDYGHPGFDLMWRLAAQTKGNVPLIYLLLSAYCRSRAKAPGLVGDMFAAELTELERQR